MGLDRLINRRRFVELQHSDQEPALGELVDVVVQTCPNLKRDQLLKAVMKRESSMTTAMGPDVAIPHARLDSLKKFILAIGRSKQGINYGQFKELQVHLVFMLFAPKNAKNYLSVLGAIANLSKDEHLLNQIKSGEDIHEAWKVLARAVGVISAQTPSGVSAMNRSICHQAIQLARKNYVDSFLLFADAVDDLSYASGLAKEFKVIVVTKNKPDLYREEKRIKDVIQISTAGHDRTGRLKLAILLALTRGLIERDERLIALSGLPGSGVLDTTVLIDASREYRSFFPADEKNPLPDDLKPEVLERVIGIAGELALEGREGKPVGTLFVVGDTENVMKMCKPMVMNPFYGYREDDRNILDPFMEETIKEFSTIDGAFVIRGDGVVVSAGTYLHPLKQGQDLPGGLGSRHEAAAGITASTKAIAVTISESTRQVSIFRQGSILTALEKPVSSMSNHWVANSSYVSP